MKASEITTWLEQDGSPDFGGIFFMDRNDLSYAVAAFEVAMKSPAFQFNGDRLLFVKKMNIMFKQKLGEGYEAEKRTGA